jgi:hypothetical protein
MVFPVLFDDVRIPATHSGALGIIYNIPLHGMRENSRDGQLPSKLIGNGFRLMAMVSSIDRERVSLRIVHRWVITRGGI